jgi:aldose 1-epimerase
MSVRRIDHGGGVEEAVIENAVARVSLLTVGCALRDWRVPLEGREVPVVLGFEDPQRYRNNPWFVGALVGRVANRIAHGRFPLGGRSVQVPVSHPPHCLHGGAEGLSTRLWRMEADSRADTVRFAYDSPDGESGFPGAVRVSVEVSLCGAALTWRMRGAPDRETPINLAQHAYYNLIGGGPACDPVRDHTLRLAASRWTPTDETLIPTGEIAPVAGTRYDYRAPRRIREADPEGLGVDGNLVLDAGRGAAPAAEVSAPNGLRLRLWTDQPGLQLFDAAPFSETGGHGGAAYGPFAGLCLEAQGFPDAPNRPDFPSVLCAPERPYSQSLKVEIAPG